MVVVVMMMVVVGGGDGGGENTVSDLSPGWGSVLAYRQNDQIGNSVKRSIFWCQCQFDMPVSFDRNISDGDDDVGEGGHIDGNTKGFDAHGDDTGWQSQNCQCWSNC